MAITSLKGIAEAKIHDGIKKTTSFRVDPNLIEFEPGFNLREDNEETAAHVDRLYKAMKEGAYVPPVDVQIVGEKIIARDGHCRTKAGKRLREEMPEYTLECRQLRGNDADAILHMLGTGSGSKPLTPLEQGKGYLRLINMGMKTADIAAKLGITRVTVDNGLTLAEAPMEVQQMVAAGEVSSTTARAAIKQGQEGVAALTDAVKEKRKQDKPATTKAGKESTKKKVTAKTLKGTAAEVKPAKEPETKTNEIAVKIDKADGEAVIEFLRGFGGENEQYKRVASAIELALM